VDETIFAASDWSVAATVVSDHLDHLDQQFKEKNKNLLRLKLKSALKIEQIS
jgi:hypothetical protein